MATLHLYFDGSNFASDFFKENVRHTETSMEDCDYIISAKIKFGEVDVKQIQATLNSYKNTEKKVVFFLCSDYGKTLQTPANVLLFRTSLYKSIRKSNEFVLPYIWESFDVPFTPLAKTEQPIVGFCGNVKNNLGYRQSCINRFNTEPKIRTNFIGRHGFWGGKLHEENYTLDFKNNILNSHFTLSNRGRGNFSIRFYQVLSLGRIPALIDTDMLFPFEEEIDWDSLIIKTKTEHNLVNKILLFWKTKEEAEIIAIQKRCKAIFDTYFTSQAYGTKLSELLLKMKSLNFELKATTETKPIFPHISEMKYKINKHINLFKSKLKI